MLIDENTFRPVITTASLTYTECLDFNVLPKTSAGGYIFIALCDTENERSKLFFVANDSFTTNVPTPSNINDAKLDGNYDRISSISMGDNS